MYLKTRRLLFWAFATIFMVAGMYLLLQANGFAIDPAGLTIARTGALSLDVTPRDAEVTVNGKRFRSPSQPFQNSVFIRNLAPNRYRVRITKHGYTTWEKDLEVAPGQVTRATEVVLWPVPVPTTALESAIDDFWITNRGLVTKTAIGLRYHGRMIKGDHVAASNPRSPLVITSDAGGTAYLIDLDRPEVALNVTDLFTSLKQRQLGLSGTVPITAMLLHPFSPSKLLITSRTSLYQLDARKVELEKLFTSSAIYAPTLGANECFILDGDGTLSVVNLILKTVSREPVRFATSSTLTADPTGSVLLVRSATNTLSVYRRANGTLEPIAPNVIEAVLAPDNRRVAMQLADGTLSILYLDDYEGDVQQAAGATTTLSSGEWPGASSPRWLPEHPSYLLALEGSNLIVSELDPREPRNRYVLNNQATKFAVDGNSLYVLTTGGELLLVQLP